MLTRLNTKMPQPLSPMWQRREPTVRMAYWGEAASYSIPTAAPYAAHLKLGRESSERAVVILRKTPREQEYITADCRRLSRI